MSNFKLSVIFWRTVRGSVTTNLDPLRGCKVTCFSIHWNAPHCILFALSSKLCILFSNSAKNSPYQRDRKKKKIDNKRIKFNKVIERTIKGHVKEQCSPYVEKGDHFHSIVSPKCHDFWMIGPISMIPVPLERYCRVHCESVTHSSGRLPQHTKMGKKLIFGSKISDRFITTRGQNWLIFFWAFKSISFKR